MRKLITQDAIDMAKLLKHMDLKESILKAYQEGKTATGKNAKDKSDEIGINIVFTLISACGDDEFARQFYHLLGAITEKDESIIPKQSIDVTINDIKQIAKENNLGDFFKGALGIVKHL